MSGFASRPQALRHPGLVPGSTRPRGQRPSLRPSPSKRSEPRNESGMTDGVGRRLRVAIPLTGECVA